MFQKEKEPIEVHLQMTAFADMTLPEVLRLVAECRREDPAKTELHEDRVMRVRHERSEKIKAIGVEHNLSRSYSTSQECKKMASVVFAGARYIVSEPLPGTTRPGSVATVAVEGGRLSLGGGDIPQHAKRSLPADDHSDAGGAMSPLPVGLSSVEVVLESEPVKHVEKNRSSPPAQTKDQMLPRPENLKMLE